MLGSALAAPAGGPRVLGRVLDEAGFPLGGVKVYLLVEDPDAGKRRRYDARAVTAPDGTFNVAVDRGRSYGLTIPATVLADPSERERQFALARRKSVAAGANLAIRLSRRRSP